MNTEKLSKDLNEMNDDCIEEVMRRLPIIDLCKVAMTCTRLNSVAEGVFSRLHATECYTLKIASTTDDEVTELNDSSILLPAFGGQIQELQIVSSRDKSKKVAELKMLSDVNTYCSKNTTIKLRLVNFDINSELIEHLADVLDKISNLELHRCSINNSFRSSTDPETYRILLEYCINLQALRAINDVEWKFIAVCRGPSGDFDEIRITDLSFYPYY